MFSAFFSFVFLPKFKELDQGFSKVTYLLKLGNLGDVVRKKLETPSNRGN